MKKRVVLITGIILLAISVLIFIYPTASKLINRINDDSLTYQYSNRVSAVSPEDKEEYLRQAKKYNENLNNTVADVFSEDAFNVNPAYEDILSFENGQIGVVEIPKINVKLPIYHGVSEDVLKNGAAHMANTAFPIGGVNTNSVISAHTAYPGKVFFDELTELDRGDTFSVNVLNDKLTYMVSDIWVVDPGDVSKLKIVPGKELITLVTCTPYAINSHRLIVRGERINSEIQTEPVTKEKSAGDKHSNNHIIALSILICTAAVAVWVIFRIRRKFREGKNNDKKS